MESEKEGCTATTQRNSYFSWIKSSVLFINYPWSVSTTCLESTCVSLEHTAWESGLKVSIWSWLTSRLLQHDKMCTGGNGLNALKKIIFDLNRLIYVSQVKDFWGCWSRWAQIKQDLTTFFHLNETVLAFILVPAAFNKHDLTRRLSSIFLTPLFDSSLTLPPLTPVFTGALRGEPGRGSPGGVLRLRGDKPGGGGQQGLLRAFGESAPTGWGPRQDQPEPEEPLAGPVDGGQETGLRLLRGPHG